MQLFAGQPALAIAKYTTAIDMLKGSNDATQLLAALHCNRCLAHLKLHQNFEVSNTKSDSCHYDTT